LQVVGQLCFEED